MFCPRRWREKVWNECLGGTTKPSCPPRALSKGRKTTRSKLTIDAVLHLPSEGNVLFKTARFSSLYGPFVLFGGQSMTPFRMNSKLEIGATPVLRHVCFHFAPSVPSGVHPWLHRVCRRNFCLPPAKKLSRLVIV